MANDVAVASLKSRALYSDLNSKFGQSGSADILFDKPAIQQSLYNIFRTHIGECGPIFMPEFGSMLPYLLQEPLDLQTAFKVKAATIQAAQRWEPRITINVGLTTVSTDLTMPGYLIQLVYTIRQTGEVGSTNIPLSQRGADGTTIESAESIALPTWMPTILRNLELWFDAADSKTFVQSINGLSKWKDKSGRSNHASVSSSADPDSFSLKQGAISGLSALHVLDKGTIPTTSSATISPYPARLLLTRGILIGARLHLFAVVRNPNAGFNGEDLFGVNFLRQLSAPFNTVLGVDLGLSVLHRRPEMYTQSITSVNKDLVMEEPNLNNNETMFLEMKYGAGEGFTLIFNGAATAGSAAARFNNMTVDVLLESFGNILSAASLMIGEIILVNGNEPIPEIDMVYARNYLKGKWLNTSVVTTVPVITPSIKSDIFLTYSILPQASTDTNDLKIVIQHTRTSPDQNIQFKILASGSGVNDGAKNCVLGSLRRYRGAAPSQVNPLVSNHRLINYTDAELIGPFSVPGFWNELLDYGLVFTSKASNQDRTEITISYPTGVNPAYPRVSFSNITLTVSAIGSALSVPASITFNLP